MLIEPFHRMFSLDNRAIQFPHAEVERVSVGTFIECTRITTDAIGTATYRLGAVG